MPAAFKIIAVSLYWVQALIVTREMLQPALDAAGRAHISVQVCLIEETRALPDSSRRSVHKRAVTYGWEPPWPESEAGKFGSRPHEN